MRPSGTNIVAAFTLAVLTSCSIFAQNPAPPGAAVALNAVNLDATRLRVHFIDVGPGMAVLIETPNDRRHVFVDGGKWGLAHMAQYVAHFAPPATTPIDIAIVTHPDFDHFAGMRRVFNTHRVGQFWYTGYDSTSLGTTWRAFEQDVVTEEDCEVYRPLEDFTPLSGGTRNQKRRIQS